VLARKDGSFFDWTGLARSNSPVSFEEANGGCRSACHVAGPRRLKNGCFLRFDHNLASILCVFFRLKTMKGAGRDEASNYEKAGFCYAN
jgi:hypothetical protein